MVFVTGKHYYALARHAEESGLSGVAFVRLEQLCPFPTKELQEAVAPFKRAKSEFQADLIGSLKLDNIWGFVQLIFGPHWPMNQLNENPNIS